MEKKGMVFFKSFKEVIEKLDKDNQLIMYNAITEYGLFDIEPNFNENLMLELVWMGFKTQIDIQNDKFEKKASSNRNNGLKGGRPPKTEETKLVDVKAIEPATYASEAKTISTDDLLEHFKETNNTLSLTKSLQIENLISIGQVKSIKELEETIEKYS